MNIAYIDLATKEPCFAVSTDEKVISMTKVADTKDEQNLMPLFIKTIDAANIKISDLTNIACVIGPGGFMSLRVAAAFANALAYGLNIPSTGIHLSDLLYAQIADDFVWIHSTKKSEIFIRGFGKYAKLWKEPTYENVDDACAKLPADAQYIGDVIPEHTAKLGGRKEISEMKSLESILPSYLSSLKYDSDTLIPWYGRSL